MKLTKYNLDYTYSKKTRILRVQTNFRVVPLRFNEVTESTYWDHIDPEQILFIIRTFTKEEVLQFQREWNEPQFIYVPGNRREVMLNVKHRRELKHEWAVAIQEKIKELVKKAQPKMVALLSDPVKAIEFLSNPKKQHRAVMGGNTQTSRLSYDFVPFLGLESDSFHSTLTVQLGKVHHQEFHKTLEIYVANTGPFFFKRDLLTNQLSQYNCVVLPQEVEAYLLEALEALNFTDEETHRFHKERMAYCARRSMELGHY